MSIKQGALIIGFALIVYLKNLCGRGAWECHEPYVVVDSFADAFQCLCHGMIGQMGFVVLLAQVAKPNLFYLWRVVIGKELSCLAVGEVSVGASDACLQQRGVGAFGQHLLVVVGFEYEVVGLCHVVLYSVGDVADVGDEAEICIFALDAVSHVVASVVRYLEGGDVEVAHDGCFALSDDPSVDGAYFLGHAIVFLHAFVDSVGGVDGDVASLAEVAHGADVVGMVVGDKDAEDALEGNAPLAQHFFDGAYADAGINEYAVGCGAEVKAVSATSTGQAYKLQFHVELLLRVGEGTINCL